MKLRVRDIDVPTDNPFEQDRFNRISDIENLSDLVSNVQTPFVISVNGKWGTGKSTLVKMWRSHLEKQGILTCYFDAWACDYIEDPLIPILGELSKLVESKKCSESWPVESWEKAKRASRYIFNKGLPVLAKVATYGILDLDEKSMESAYGKFSEAIVKDALENYLQQANVLAEFKENLSTYVKSVGQGAPDNARVIFFIDELDRCRPSFALEIFERIKHVFDLEGVVFVLVNDRQQLEGSVRQIYGNEIDSAGYLRKFIDVEYQLPKVDLEPFIESVFNELDFNAFFNVRMDQRAHRDDRSSLIRHLLMYANGLNLSLREIELVSTKLALILASTGKNYNLYPPLLMFLLVIKDKEPKLYAEVVEKDLDFDRVINFLSKLSSKTEFHECYEAIEIEAYLMVAKSDRFEIGNSPRYLHHKSKSSQLDLEDRSIFVSSENNYSDRVIKMVSYLLQTSNISSIDYLVNKINFSDKFNFEGGLEPSV